MKVDSKVKVGVASIAALAAGSGAVSAQDWTGFYAGLSYGLNNGTAPNQPYVYDEGYTSNDAGAAGVFGGVRWDLGSSGAIMGVELAYQGQSDLTRPVTSDADGYCECYTLTNIIDLKLSVGTAFGNALVYGFAGVSASGTDTQDPSESYLGGSGANYGIGIDYMVTDSFSVGAEYISRHMSGYTSGGSPDNAKPLSSISLRASFNF
jgi:outer membrane immunogenic protein